MDNNKKLRPLKLWEILYRETDEDHPMGTETLRVKLKLAGFDCGRRVIYEDIELLNAHGYEVKCNRKVSNEYYVVDRAFDIAELQILMDAVQAASFITRKKTRQFVGKIAQLAGDKKADVLQKNTVEFNVPKSDNERIYYSVDTIGRAIEQQRQISFKYFDYDIGHNRVYRKLGEFYIVNPISTVFSNDNYYLMCNDDKHDNIGHYRIDRMDEVRITEQPITKSDLVSTYDLVRHKKQLFGMFNGEDAMVTFQANKKLLDHIFDKFGDDIIIKEGENDTVMFSSDVQVSNAFLGWCCSFGNSLKVISPKRVVEEVKLFLNETAMQYS